MYIDKNEIENKFVGSGRVGCFSFFMSKVLDTVLKLDNVVHILDKVVLCLDNFGMDKRKFDKI